MTKFSIITDEQAWPPGTPHPFQSSFALKMTTVTMGEL